jgi:hypothetical protein
MYVFETWFNMHTSTIIEIQLFIPYLRQGTVCTCVVPHSPWSMPLVLSGAQVEEENK